MERETETKILALSLGAKYMGIAVLKDLELVYWGIKRLKGSGLSEEGALARLEGILRELLSIYRPDTIVIKEPLPNQLRFSPFLKAAMRSVKKVMKGKKTLIIPLFEMKRYICKGEKPNKMNLEKMIVTRYYPWLYRRYQKDLQKEIEGQWWKRKYHEPLFEAIGLGIYCYEELKRRSSSRAHPSPSKPRSPDV